MIKKNNRLKRILSFFDSLPFTYKTSFLLFIITGGMIIIIFLSQISIHTLKNAALTLIIGKRWIGKTFDKLSCNK